jgi:hypothetical protein
MKGAHISNATHSNFNYNPLENILVDMKTLEGKKAVPNDVSQQ